MNFHDPDAFRLRWQSAAATPLSPGELVQYHQLEPLRRPRRGRHDCRSGCDARGALPALACYDLQLAGGGIGGSPTIAGLVLGSDGALYGTTSEGGGGCGMVFRLGFLDAPVLLNPRASGGSFSFDFQSQTSVSYQLQSATNLPTASWLDEGRPFSGTGGVVTANLPLGPNQVKFFRLRLAN